MLEIVAAIGVLVFIARTTIRVVIAFQIA